MEKLLSETDGVVVRSKVHEWRVLTTEMASAAVIHLTVAVDEGLKWTPGAAISILPSNSEENVRRLLELLNVNGSDLFLPPEAIASGSIFPTSPIYSRIKFPITNYDVLTHVAALRVYGKSIMNILQVNAKNPAEASIIKAFTQQNQEWKKFLDEHISLISLLERFPSSRPPFRHLIEHLTPLQPRFYSIASSCEAHPGKLSIAYKVKDGGLCTSWLRSLCRQASGSQQTPVEIPLQLRVTHEFKMPADPSTPMILIGPGTGVSPFIGFLQQREYQMKLMAEEVLQRKLAEHDEFPDEVRRRFGEVHLFFGCRTSDTDYLFRNELERYNTNGTLTALHVAFSQEPSDGLWYGGSYVQDKLQGCATHLANLILNHNAYVFVCGDAESMAKDVQRVLTDVIEEYRLWTTKEAADYLERLAEEGRYQRDIWS
eukprot:GDKJ01043867.1.p1 GENE.GDKJ01043867.1~~GDKJ01043867.1.p1  ORF type:complete len:472 (-),score=19.14 GDKJ01043867.1:142-1428(-)